MNINEILAWLDSRRRVGAENVRGLLSNPGETLSRLGSNVAQDFAQQSRGLLNAAANRNSAIPQLREEATNQMLSALPMGGLAGVMTYHGTPHKFEGYDLSKMGTGEGAQAYGHGMYFAENPKVAKKYAHPDSPTIYKQDLPDEVLPKMLKWDRPLSEQPHVADISGGQDMPGSLFYWELSRALGGPDKAAAMLAKQGIPGVSYLDAGSRSMGGGQGTLNHVIWDQGLLNRMRPTLAE